VLGVHPFRVIRGAAKRVGDLGTYDPLDDMEESIQRLSLQRREFGYVIQVAIYEDMPKVILTWGQRNKQNATSYEWGILSARDIWRNGKRSICFLAWTVYCNSELRL